MIAVFSILFLLGLGGIAYLVFSKKPEAEIVYEEVRDPVVLHIAVPRQNDKTPLAAEQMFASIHGILRDAKRSVDFLSFEIVSDKQTGVKFYAVVPRYLVNFVEGQIYAQYPNAEISMTEDYVGSVVKGMDPETYRPFVATGEIEFDKDFIFPIKTFRDFEVDPLAAITSALSSVVDGEQAVIQILIRPIGNYWQDSAKNYITAVKEGKEIAPVKNTFLKNVAGGIGSVFVGILGVFLSSSSASTKGAAEAKPVVKLAPGQEEELSQISDKMTKVGFEVGVRIIVKALESVRAEQLLHDVIASFKQFTTANLNGFIHSKTEKTGAQMYQEFKRRFLSAETIDILNITELASLYHLPNVSVETPNISWTRSKKAEPPMNLPSTDCTIFGETDYRGKRTSFGIRDQDRCLHFYLLGMTGSGKSTVFKNMIISDILSGKGVGVIDPHGDLVEDLLNFVPSSRINDVVYLDPSDSENPIGFNMLELEDQTQRDLVADGVVEVFKMHFGTSWGPRLQYLLHNAVLTAIEVQGTTLLAIQRMLVDKGFRKFLTKQVKDPVLKKFWDEEYAQMETNSRLITEAVAPIQNKVGRFLGSATIRNIVGQVKSTINLQEIMDTGKIFLVNLSQGRLGAESSALLGGMIVTRIQSTALERAKIPIEQRKEFFLFVDEFQNYATDSFGKILSEARKYKLGLHMTHQFLGQLPESVVTAVFGNVGTLCSLVIGPTDAAILANEFAPTFAAEDLVSLDRHSMYVKMSIDGKISLPFSAHSLDLRYQRGSNRPKVLAVSRERYGRPRAIIEEKIKRWSEQEYSKKGNRVEDEVDEGSAANESRPVRADINVRKNVPVQAHDTAQPRQQSQPQGQDQRQSPQGDQQRSKSRSRRNDKRRRGPRKFDGPKASAENVKPASSAPAVAPVKQNAVQSGSSGASSAKPPLKGEVKF